MPEIIRSKKQDDALDAVNALLKEVAKCNAAYRNQEAHYTVSEGKHKIAVHEELNEKIRAVIKGHRKLLIKEINALCAKYRIELDKSEKEIISADSLTESSAGASSVKYEGKTVEDALPSGIVT